MYFQRHFEFSARSAKIKRDTSFSDVFLCCTAIYAFTSISDCIFTMSCYIVVLYCLLFFSVLSVLFYRDFTLLQVLCLIRVPSLILPSRFCVASSGFKLSCLLLLLSISPRVVRKRSAGRAGRWAVGWSDCETLIFINCQF